MLPHEQENKENALNHASSFSCRSRNTGNGVQKERKTRKRGIPQRKMQPSVGVTHLCDVETGTQKDKNQCHVVTCGSVWTGWDTLFQGMQQVVDVRWMALI